MEVAQHLSVGSAWVVGSRPVLAQGQEDESHEVRAPNQPGGRRPGHPASRETAVVSGEDVREDVWPGAGQSSLGLRTTGPLDSTGTPPRPHEPACSPRGPAWPGARCLCPD